MGNDFGIGTLAGGRGRNSALAPRDDGRARAD